MRPEDVAFRTYAGTRDPADLATVFDHTAPKLLLLASHVAPAGVDPQDLLQATFVTAMESAGTFDPGRPVLPWLFGILTNHARLAARRARRSVDPERFVATRPGLTPDAAPDGAAADREFADAFAAALEGLNAVHRRALVLHLVHGLSATQIAHTEGAPPPTVKSRLRRGMELLRRALPAGVAPAVVLGLSADALAQTRHAVLAHAARHTAVATLAGGSLLSSAFAMKNILLPALAVLVGLAAWFAATDPSGTVAHTGDQTPLPRLGAPRAASPAADAAAETHAAVAADRVPTAAPADEAPAGTGALRVRVTWRGANTPAAGVTVMVRRGAGLDLNDVVHAGITDHEGEVLLTELPAGERRVSATTEEGTAVQIIPGAEATAALEVERTGTVRGVVEDGRGAPVGGARIFASLDAQEPIGGDTGVRSAADGTFELPLWTAWLSLHARLDGHAPSDTTLIRTPETGAATVRLVVGGPVATVGGLVRFAGDPPRTPARVWLYPRSTRKEARAADRTMPRFAAVRTARLDADDRFAFADVPPGDVVVTAFAPPYGVHRSVHTVAAGGTAEVTIDLQQGARLAGTVRDGAGRPLADVRVFVNGLQRGWSRVARTGADGAYALDCLPIGRYEASAFHPRNGRMVQEVTGRPGELDTWDPVLVARGALRGRVIDEQGAPLANWRLRCRLGSTETRSAADGTFALEARKDELQTLYVFEPDASSPRAVRRRVLADGPELEIRIDAASALNSTLAGRLRAGDAPAPGQVLEVRHADIGYTHRFESFGADGGFRLEHLPPGEYVLRASAEGYPEAVVGRCTLYPERTTVVDDLTLPEAVPVELRVRRSDGRTDGAARWTHVSILDTHGHYLHTGRARVAAGRLDLPLLAPGSYRLQIGGTDVLWIERELELTAGRPHRETIELRACRPCTVRLASDRPLPGPVRVQGFDQAGAALFDAHLTEVQARFSIDIGLPAARVRLVAIAADGRRGEAWLGVDQGETETGIRVR